MHSPGELPEEPALICLASETKEFKELQLETLLCINKRAGVCRCAAEEASDGSYSVDCV